MNPAMTELTPETRQARFVTLRTAEKWLIEQARVRPDIFIFYMTGRPLAKHHKIWLANIFEFNPAKKKNRLQFIAPRESAKTTIMAYSLLWFISRFPWTSNAIVSVSSQQSKRRMSMIREIIDNDPRYKNVFPWIKIDQRQPNNINQFSLECTGLFNPESEEVVPINYTTWRSMLGKLGSLMNPTLVIGSLRSKAVIGSRYNGFLILDDIVDHNYLRESLQQDVYDYIMGSLVPCVQEGGKVINIMTRWMVNDVAEKIKQNSEWYSIEIQAIYTDEAGNEFSYWPEFWSIERLHQRKEEMQEQFEIMFMNNPQGLTSAKFNSVMFQRELPATLPPFTAVYVGTDFALSTKQNADFTTFSAIGIDVKNNIYVLDLRRMKTTPDIVSQELGQFAQDCIVKYGRLDSVVIENTAFQSVMQFMLVERFPHLPATPYHPIGDKGHRADILARKMNAGEVFFNTKCVPFREFVRECVNFPLYGHDDLLDSVSIVLQFFSKSLSNVSVSYVTSPFLL